MLPKVVMIACVSLDGFIARWDGDVPNQMKYGGWTSPEDKEIFRMELSRSDVVLVGYATYKLMPGFKKDVAVLTKKHFGKLKGETTILPEPGAVGQWLDKIEEEGAKQVLLCGGAVTYTCMLAWDYVDELALIVEPVAFVSGVPMLCEMDGAPPLDLKFKLLSASKLNDLGTLYLRYGRRV